MKMHDGYTQAPPPPQPLAHHEVALESYSLSLCLYIAFFIWCHLIFGEK